MCYKCNDTKLGHPGCDLSEGCDYYPPNQQLNCKKCKEGYFEYIEGQCFLCSTYNPNCAICHYNIEKDEVICDSCKSEIYSLNKEENICELNDCQEYPEISPGCIICKDKLNEYKRNNKCQMCKYGYFKTKEEKCVYCSSEEIGGLGCYECGYETNENGIETNKIICKICYSDINNLFGYYNDYSYLNFENLNSPLLSKEGKCYNCQIQFSENCKNCELLKDENGIESLKCISCISGYYLTPEGNCVNILNLIPRIANCQEYLFFSGNKNFKLNIYDYSFSISFSSYIDNDAIYKDIYFTVLKDYEKKCLSCRAGFYLNDNGICEELNYDKSSFNSILSNYEKLGRACSSFCQYNYSEKVYIILKINPKYDGDIGEFSIRGLYYNNYISFIDYFKEFDKIKSCLNNLGEGGEFSPKDLKNCKKAYYFPDNDTYICKSCLREYILSNDGNFCVKKDSCTIENIGTEIMPQYGCIESYNRLKTFTLVKNENREKEFIEANGDLTGCFEADADTSYINSKYNCTKCIYMHIPLFSKFFDRIICQNIKDKIIKENSISYDLYNKAKEKINAKRGGCSKGYLFTPDNEYCYRCDDEFVGIPGCKGACSFSLQRNKPLRCEGECKTGYIESSEGICSPCNSINKGCYECHYDNEYPSNYKGIKRKRRFVCDFCEEGYVNSPNGECLDCKDLGLEYCSKCEVDPINNENYICTKCDNYFFLDETGQCQVCATIESKAIYKNKCIDCDKALQGGVEHCLYCNNKEDRIICKQCSDGYILLTNNNTCLEIAKNKILENFYNCEQLTMENNKLFCSKCKYLYSLVKRNNIQECTYIKSLYTYNFRTQDEIQYYIVNDGKIKEQDYITYQKNDYNYKRYSNNYPCQEAENRGTEENPLYSCLKCYEFIEYDIYYEINGYYDYNIYPIKITDINSNLSFCIYIDDAFNEGNIKIKELRNCSEATYKIYN